MDSIPTVDARRDRFGYWVLCPYCSREGRPRVHVHRDGGLQQAYCALDDLPFELRERSSLLMYEVREEPETCVLTHDEPSDVG